jgi:chromatin structure-remodeling complex subunit SFH1
MTAPVRLGPPQAFISSYAPRIRTYGNALLTPVAPSAPQVPLGRAGRSGRAAAQAVNYAELDGYDEDDFEDDEGRRRPTGLRSLRREEQAGTPTVQVKKVGLETDKPVAVQGIWRDWMGKQGRLVYAKQDEVERATY